MNDDDKPTLTLIDGGLADPFDELDEDDDRDDLEPDMADLAWIAKRLIYTTLGKIDFTEMASLASGMFDDADVSIIRTLIRNATFHVDIDVTPRPIEAVAE